MPAIRTIASAPRRSSRAAILAPAASAAPTPATVVAGHDVTTIAARPTGDPTTWGPPPPRPAPYRAPAPAAAPTPARRRDWLLPTLLVLLIGGSIGLAVALVARTQSSGGPGPAGGNPAAAVTISSVSAFDPLGDGHEHDNEARLAIDGKPNTAWHTETYSAPDFGTKPGVGLVITLDRATSLDQLRVTSPTQGWSATVYVADDTPSTLDGWGAPVTSAADISGDTTFALNGAKGRTVLLWVTELGGAPYRAQIDELSIAT